MLPLKLFFVLNEFLEILNKKWFVVKIDDAAGAWKPPGLVAASAGFEKEGGITVGGIGCQHEKKIFCRPVDRTVIYS